jgi:Leucine-rich repeat (LRR) protein
MKKTLLTLCSMFFATVLFAQVSNTEKQALLDLYVNTNGDQWINTWDLNEPVANWHGITVENDRVVGVSLLFNNLNGNLPATLSDLGALRILELSFNKLNGEIPREIGQLSQLEVLALNANNLHGTIPETLGALNKLKQLHMSSNKLSGTVPASLGNLSTVEVFNVFDNDLKGSLPVALADNMNLRELMIAENDFENTEIFSVVLLSNSGAGLNLKEPSLSPSAKTIIAIESPEDGN